MSDWIERERAAQEERERRAQLDVAERERQAEATIARVRALGTDDGTGKCRHCGAQLGVDGEGRKLHPANDCPGPTPDPCPICGKPWRIRRLTNAGASWEPTCGPIDHARAARTPEHETALPPIRRAGNFGDRDDDP